MLLLSCANDRPSEPALACLYLLWAAGFDDGDLRISAMQLKMFLDEAAGTGSGAVSVPFDALRYTAGECNYGEHQACPAGQQLAKWHQPLQHTIDAANRQTRLQWGLCLWL